MLLSTNSKQVLRCMWEPVIWFTVQIKWLDSMIQIPYESSLVIIDRGFISLTHFRPMFHICRNQVIGFY